MQIVTRKFRSVASRLKNAADFAYAGTIKHVVEVLTDRYWLIDYLPTLLKRRSGVLLVRLDLIGDFILWLDSAQAYRRLYPNQKITVAVNSTCVDLASSLSYWDAVIGINVHELRTNYFYRLMTLIRLRWANFSIAIQPTFSREFVGDVALRSSFAPKRFGYEGDINNIPAAIKAKTDLWYTSLISNNLGHFMELSINAHFVRGLGADEFLSGIPAVAQTINLPAKFQFSSPYVVIAPGASWQPKMWPVQNFSLVIKNLMLAVDIKIVLCGSTQDADACAELTRLVSPISVTDLSGKTSLLELVELIRNATAVVTNDSSPAHIAAATNTPSVCILGGGHFGRFLPYILETKTMRPSPLIINHVMNCYGCNWQCVYPLEIRAPVACIGKVSVLNVSTALRTILKLRDNTRTTYLHTV